MHDRPKTTPPAGPRLCALWKLSDATCTARVAAIYAVAGLAAALLAPSQSVDRDRVGAPVALSAGAGDQWRERLRLADDPRLTGWLTGRTREQVISRLGGGNTGALVVPPEASPDALVYSLGRTRSLFRMDVEILVVEFGPDDRVSHFWTETKHL